MTTDAASSAVCLVNIGPKQRAMRLRFGAVALGVGLVLFAVALGVDLSRWWRVGLFLPFAAAATGYFQARRKT